MQVRLVIGVCMCVFSFLSCAYIPAYLLQKNKFAHFVLFARVILSLLQKKKKKKSENAGYWRSTSFLQEAKKEYEENGEIKFFDSNTGKLLYVAPRGRSFDDFIRESNVHGWPSFRDEEVVWDNGVRVLPDGETVSLDGTHLGHNLPDATGNRYCINLISVAGNPVVGQE